MSSVVGRDAEIAAVADFLASPDPRSAVLAIMGEPGIGKTMVWEQAVRLARDRGAVVLTARPAEAEARLSFAGLADLLSAVPPEVVARLPAPQARAIDVALLRAEASRPPARRLLGTAFGSLVRDLLATSEVVVAIDDVQWLDPSSSAVIEFGLRRLRDQRLRVVLSLRGTSSGLLGVGAGELLERLDLGPLSLAALHRIFVERLGRTFVRPTLVRIAAACGGSPFYGLEIARLVADPASGSPLPVPEDVLGLVRARIRSLPAESRDALLLAAAAARPDVQFVDEAALAAGEEAGLVEVAADGRIAFAHPLYASAVYSSAPIARRRAAHKALAVAVSDPGERARHLALACEGTDERVAAEVEAAALRAHGRGAPDAAAELTDLALQLTPAGDAAVDARRLRLAKYLELSGQFEPATRLLEEICATVPEGDVRAEALLLLSGLVYRRAGESEAAVVAREAVAVARDPILQARCQAVLAGWTGTVDTLSAAEAARKAVEALEKVDADPSLLSFALANLVRVDLFVGNGYDELAAERALALERSAPPPAVDDRVVYKLGQWLRYIDDFDGARRRLGEAEQAAQDEGDDSSLVNILLNRLLVELWAGAWTTAGDLARRLAETGDQLGVPHAAPVWQALLDAHLGRLEAVREAALAADRSEPTVDMLYLRSLGLVELAAGLYAEADVHLRDATELIERVGIQEPAIWRVDGEAIEAAIAVGELERAEALAARFEQQASRSRIPWSVAVSSRCRGLVVAARGDLDGAAAVLEDAVVAHESCPVPFERARTLLALGRIRRRLKQKRLAREAFDAALAIFEELGTELWAERTRDELRRVTTRKATRTLTETEREIAQLAAAGLTNQAIAERAFVTRKTVEANLARVYRKLGISSRAQLSRALEEHPAQIIS